MYIIYSKLEQAIWVTETPLDKKSGVWHFYDSDEEFEDEFNRLVDKYKGCKVYTLRYWERTHKARSVEDD